MNPEILGKLHIDDDKRRQLLIDKTWITADGELIAVEAMEQSHIQNSLLRLKEFKHERYFRDWARILRKELTKRLKAQKNGRSIYSGR